MKQVFELVLENIEHVAKMLPVLFLSMAAAEFFSHRTASGWVTKTSGSTYLGPVMFSVLGLIPQCSFSVVATVLYLNGLTPLGTLISAYISTSDEAVPVLLGDPASARWVFPLLGTKLIWGIVAGCSINLALKRSKRSEPSGPSLPHSLSCAGKPASWGEISLHSLRRTARVAMLVLGFSLAFDLISAVAGNSIFPTAKDSSLGEIALTSLFGMIPTCGASVAVAQAFSKRIISFPALIGGLVANSGAGTLVLLRECRQPSRIITVLTLLFVVALVSGILSSLFMT